MNRLRSHPINILEKTSKYLILLLLPILRTLWAAIRTFQTGEIFSWFESVWMTLLVVALILALGWYGWYSFTFSYEENGISACRGVLLKQKWFLPYEQITSVSITYPWYFLPFRAVRLKADTDGGSTRTADFSVTVVRHIAEDILYSSKLPFSDTKELRHFYIPNNWAIALFSFLSSNSVTGAIYFAASVSQLSNFVGKDLTDRLMNQFGTLVSFFKFIPPAVTVFILIVVGTWGISFLNNLFSNLRFCVSRRSDVLEIEAGIFTRRKISIQTGHINALILRQSLLTHLFRLHSASILCTGYGQKMGENNMLMPADSSHGIGRNLAMLLPEFPMGKNTLRPKRATLSRFLFPPIMLIASLAVLFGSSLFFLEAFRRTLLALWVIAEIPSIWWLLYKWYAFYHTGLGFGAKAVSIHYTFGFRILRGSIPYEKITKVVCSQSLFQKVTHCCNVYFYLYGESRHRINIMNLDFEEVRQLLPFPMEPKEGKHPHEPA